MVTVANDGAVLNDFGSLLAGLSVLGQLPAWLLAPLQSDQVIAALRTRVPEFASGEWAIRKCKVRRMFLKDNSGCWEGIYTLDCTPPGAEEQEIRLHGRLVAPGIEAPNLEGMEPQPFGAPEWRVWLPELRLDLSMEPPEAELSSLEQLTDPEQAQSLMPAVLHQANLLNEDASVTIRKLTVLSYKPASRCTIRYDLDYQPEQPSAPETVIGKVYRQEKKARNAYEGMLRQWESPLSSGDQVHYARPLALLPEQKAMFQEALRGETSLEDILKATLDQPDDAKITDLHAWMRKTGLGLAAFHQSGAYYGEAVLLEERIAELYQLVGRLAVVFPDIPARVIPLIHKLESLAALYPPDSPVPTHGTFNPEQVLIDGETLDFIDFDSCCIAEPAMDLGLFIAAILDTGMNEAGLSETARRERLTLLYALGNTFLHAYQEQAQVSIVRAWLWQVIDFLRNSLHFWIKVKPAEPDFALFTLEDLLIHLH